jgi:hypothetical protein
VPYLTNRADAYTAVQCTDSTVPTDPAAYSRVAQDADRSEPEFGRIAVVSTIPCAFWQDHDADHYIGPWNQRTAAPILVLNSPHLSDVARRPVTSPRVRDSLDDLGALLGQAADALNRPYAFLEKDFWAMEVLRVAARDRPIALRDGTTGTVRTVFKGGTSLSRVYGLIDRFSGESLFSKLPPGVRYGSPGSMHKSLWDILGTLSPRPIGRDHPLNCTNTGGRGGFQTPDRWCADLALTVERIPIRLIRARQRKCAVSQRLSRHPP